MGNKICDLPALLENQLQDMAQLYQDIDYTDISKFEKRQKDWDKAYALIIKLDKAGFYELDLLDNPTEFTDYNKLINLIKGRKK